MNNNKSSEFLFLSHYLNIRDSIIHYVDVDNHTNSDTTFLFLHGNPTLGYLWRNIIPWLTSSGRCIAPDLIGFGKSGKPDIGYTFQDHIAYISAFIQKLDLKNIVLIIHDWGGAIGFNYAMNHPQHVKGIVFMETFCKPIEWSEFDFVTRQVFKKFRDPQKGQKWNGKYNLFLRFILPLSMNRKLTKTEKEAYHKPFQTIESRKPIVKFPQELPFKNENTLNEQITENYYAWLQQSAIPKLLLYAEPGMIIKKNEVELYKAVFPGLTAKCVGEGKHYIQEDQPENIGKEIRKWFNEVIT